MNLKTTVVLLALAGTAVLLFLFGPSVALWLGLTPAPPDAAGEGTSHVLDAELTRAKLSRIEIEVPNQPKLVFERGDNNEWTLPGHWPTRKQPGIEQLVSLLTDLKPRFLPEPVHKNNEDGYHLRDFGIDPPAATVTVSAGGKSYQLRFGQKADRDLSNRADWPTYVQLGEKEGDDFKYKNEVVRLAPDVLAVLKRRVDYYQQRRLFPSDRIARKDNPQEKEERLTAKAIAVKQKGDNASYTLARVGDDWQLTDPHRDQPVELKVNDILTVLPDVWVEEFVDRPEKDLAIYGLEDPPAQTVSVTTPAGQTMTMLVGKVAPPPSSGGLMVPPAPLGGDEYRYAKLQNNDRVFKIKYSKLKQQVFVPFTEMRDSNVVVFRAADAKHVELIRDGQKIVLDKDATSKHWRLVEPIKADAEETKVEDLLNQLVNLRAEGKDDIVYKADPKFGLDKPAERIRVTVEEEKGDKNDPKARKERTFTVLLGKESEPGTFHAQVEGMERISKVKGNVQTLAKLDVRDFRGRHLFAFAGHQIDTLTIQRKGETIALKQTPGQWRLTAPVQAEADVHKIGLLASDLSNLEVIEYAKPLEPNVTGLDKPTLTVTVSYNKDGKKEEQTLLIGKQREGAQEYYARLKDRPDVVVIGKFLVEGLDHDSLSYRPVEFPRIPTEDVAALQIQKEKQKPYSLVPKEFGWKITGPFEETALPTLAQPLVEAVAALKVERYVAHTATALELDKYGLKEPYLRLTLMPAKKKDGAALGAAAGGSALVPSTKELKERVLLIGAPVEKEAGARYARLADSDAILVVDKKLLATVDLAAVNLLDPRVLALAPDAAIESFQNNAGGKPLKVQLQGDRWQVAESPAGAFPADREAVDALLLAWKTLKAKSFAAYGANVDWAKYGLDKPAITATLTTKKPGDKPHEVKLGKPVESGDGSYYARVENKPGVVVLDAPVAAELRRTYLDFVNRQVLDGVEAGGIVKLGVKQGNDEVQVQKEDTGWQVLVPEKSKADDPTLEDLTRQLASLRARRVAAYSPKKLEDKELKEFGLDTPASLIRLKINPGEKVIELQVGKAADATTGDRFARVKDSSTVAVLPGDLLRDLLSPALHFRDRIVARVRDDVDRLQLERAGQKAVFAKADGTWKMTEPVEAEADHDELEEFVNSLSRLRADEFVANKPADLKTFGLDQPQVRWHVQAGGKDVVVLLIGKPGPDRMHDGKKEGPRVYAKVDGNDLVFLLDPRATGRALGKFRSRRIFASLAPDQIQTLRYQSRTSPFVLEKKDDRWEIAGQPGLVNTKAIEETVQTLANLRAERFVAEKVTDLTPYGLKEPQLKLEIQTAKGKRELQIGATEGASRKYYARVGNEATADVFLLSEADGARLVRDVKAFQQAPPNFPPQGGFPPPPDR